MATAGSEMERKQHIGKPDAAPVAGRLRTSDYVGETDPSIAQDQTNAL